MSFIEVNNVCKEFGKVKALSGMSLTMEEGQQYVIKGASGSGKSTLMYLLGGLDRATSGEVIVGGRDISSLSDSAMAAYRNKFIGFVFQFHFLLPSMTCLNNIYLPAQIAGVPTGSIRDKVMAGAERLGVAHCLNKFSFELSGGEQQRVNILRALSLGPKLLLCDEPTGNLDSENSQKVIDLLREMSEKSGTTLVIVTHDENIAQQFDQKFLVKDGQVL